MNIYKLIKKYYEKGDVCVIGEKGSGKDMLTANIIAERKLPYVSNTEYKRKGKIPLTFYQLDFSKINVGENTYKDFISGDIKYYEYPYPIGCDIYISDVGVYLPSQYCNELNRDYKHLATLTALSRQLGFRIHTNCQNLNRIYDKLREQSRTYITCLGCKVIPIGKTQLIIQKIRISEKYQSAIDNVPRLKLPLYMRIGKDKTLARLYALNYQIQHGIIEEYTLIYINKSDYDTTVFRSMLKRGKKNEEEKDKKE